MTTPASLEREHTLATAVARYDELRMRDLLAPGAEDLPADEQLEPGPLSRQEALELLALSELIARKAAYGRQLTVRSARAAGCFVDTNRRCTGHHQAIGVGGPQPVDRPAGEQAQCLRLPEHG